MQVFGLPGHVIRQGVAASRVLSGKTPDILLAARREAVMRWRRAMAQGLCARDAARAVGVSRATLYRWERTPELKSRRPHRLRKPSTPRQALLAVERLRKQYPMWGKRKIAVLLARAGFVLCVSTVGRILARLVARGAVVAVPILRRKPSTANARRVRFTFAQRHAKRLPKGRKAHLPGQLVQIDTLSINIRPDKAIKHFTAYDPVAKWTIARVAQDQTAGNARALLSKLLEEAPFPVTGIQVDGGSEFRSLFEEECQKRGLELFVLPPKVLPPKRPDINGCVERAQSTWRYEFYAIHDLPHHLDKLQREVDAFAHHFNHQRPHQALAMKTPAQYLESLSDAGMPASHMS